MVAHQRAHLPDRPRWTCYADGQPWPCDAAREELATEMDRVGLAMFMGDRMVEAARDLPSTPPGELFERFLAWTRNIPGR